MGRARRHGRRRGSSNRSSGSGSGSPGRRRRGPLGAGALGAGAQGRAGPGGVRGAAGPAGLLGRRQAHGASLRAASTASRLAIATPGHATQRRGAALTGHAPSALPPLRIPLRHAGRPFRARAGGHLHVGPVLAAVQLPPRLHPRLHHHLAHGRRHLRVRHCHRRAGGQGEAAGGGRGHSGSPQWVSSSSSSRCSHGAPRPGHRAPAAHVHLASWPLSPPQAQAMCTQGLAHEHSAGLPALFFPQFA